MRKPRVDVLGELIMGHKAVEATLIARKRAARHLYVAHDHSKQLAELITLAEEAGVPVKALPFRVLSEKVDSSNHQGVLLRADALPLYSLDEVLKQTDAPLLALDHIEDPRNFGACLRAAAELGAGGVIFPKRRSAPLSAVALKAAAGGAEYVPLVMMSNLAMALRSCRDAERWVIGAQPQASTPAWEGAWNRTVVIVIGGEGKGMSRIVTDLCDELVTLPSQQELTLNASVAAALLLYESISIRQRPADTL